MLGGKNSGRIIAIVRHSALALSCDQQTQRSSCTFTQACYNIPHKIITFKTLTRMTDEKSKEMNSLRMELTE